MIDADGTLVIWLQGARIQICLPELIRTTGRVETVTYYEDGIRKVVRETITKLYEARRLLKLVTPYLEPEAVEWMDEHFRENRKLMDIWICLREHAGDAL